MAEVIHKTELTKLVAARLGVSQASAAEASSGARQPRAGSYGERSRHSSRIRNVFREGEGGAADEGDSRRERWTND